MEHQPIGPVPQKEAYQLLSSDATLCTPLHIILLKTFGGDVYEMPAAEIFNELESRYSVKLVQAVEDRINAIITLMTSDAFFLDPLVFSMVVMTMCEGDPGFEMVEDPTVPEILWASYEVQLNRESRAVSPQVHAMVQKINAEAGDWTDISEGEEAAGVDTGGYLSNLEMNLQNQMLKLGVTSLPDNGIAAFLEGHLKAVLEASPDLQ